MSKSGLLRFDVQERRTTAFDISSVTASSELSWFGSGIERWRMNDYRFEIPESILPETTIALNLGNTIRSSTKAAGLSGAWMPFGPSALGLMPSSEPYSAVRLGASDCLVLRLSDDTFARVAKNQRVVRLRPGIISESTDLLRTLLTALHQDAWQGHPLGQMYGEALCLAVAAEIVRAAGAKTSDVSQAVTKGHINLLADYIAKNFHRQIGLAELSTLSGRSPMTIAKAFKSQFGEPPHRYLVRVRIEAAKKLIESDRLSLATVASNTGFSNHSHFTRHFHRLVGATPSEYRERIRRPRYFLTA